MWDAEQKVVTARALKADGSVAGETTLRYAGATSTYEGTLPQLAPGSYEVEVLAVDTKTANAGRASYQLTVPAP